MEKITFFAFNVILAIMLFFDFFLRGSNLIFAFSVILLVVVLLNYYFSRNEKFKWKIDKKHEALVEILIATFMMILIVVFYF
ncbi:hypothetical protein [Rummeliibacillus stabekisii]|uniref:Uncharacterized protein n=1 Tax=Rummeliibacillus stabekisii TaxID=241244 RepID=A0A143HHE5_9BACL|nr:hypothetical protein [Rummeliibacillus stabekisii]AMX01168.1 hypothetical protein ATY39_17240 [Rummeliibacillus stabekisii]